MTEKITRFFHRLISYSGSGIATYILDIAIVSMLHYGFGVASTLSLIIGFSIGVTTNYLLCYYFIYRGTTRKFVAGLVTFIILAIVGIVIIVNLTPLLQNTLQLPLLLARTVAATGIGLCNFLINTFYNFRFK